LQVTGEDFTEKFLFVDKFTTLCTFLALVAFLDFEIYQVDAVAAYLQKKLDEKIYMEILKGVEKLDGRSFIENFSSYTCLYQQCGYCKFIGLEDNIFQEYL